MARRQPLFVYTFVILWLMGGCASLRNSKLGKFYNDVTARYNGYFNAKELVLKAEKDVQSAHIDDFTQILDVHRWGNEATGKTQAGPMDKAIEKCSKVIGEHEGSKWIDDAYFTVARAYFYKSEYYAAIDLFKFLANDSKNGDTELRSRLWIVICYLQMGKEVEAQAYITDIRNNRKKFESFYTEVELINAHLKIKALNYTDAILSLEKAIPSVKDKELKYRAMFILAQLYENLGNARKASDMYAKLMRKNMAYEFQFQTRLKVAKYTNFQQKGTTEKVARSFKRLLRDDNNREFFDQIHFEIANVYLNGRNKEKAIRHYKIAAWLGEKNPSQRANTYLTLADLYFADEIFETAGAYYDSCANVVPKTHPEYDDILKQQQVLGRLIANLNTIKVQDSLIQLSTLDIAEIERRIDQYIANEAIKAEKEAEKEAIKKERENVREELNESSIANAPNMRSEAGAWYFYNPVALGKGASDFKTLWGNRLLEDNWRRSEKAYVFNDITTDDTTSMEPLDSNSVAREEENLELPPDMAEQLANLDESKRQYITNIPFLPTQKRASENLIIEALYDNGLIYYEQLGDGTSAHATFTRLIESYPGNKFEAAAHYYLYKIALDKKDEATAEKHKKFILDNYGSTQYANLILGIKDPVIKNDPVLERYYAQAYRAYGAGACDSIDKAYLNAEQQVTSNYLKDKFELLSTLCLGRSLPMDSFILSLEEYLQVFTTGDAASEARNLLRFLKQKKADSEESTDIGVDNETNTKIEEEKAYIFDKSLEGEFYFILTMPKTGTKVERIKSDLANYNTAYHRSQALNVRSLEFGDGELLFWVKTFSSVAEAQKYHRGIVSDSTFSNTASGQPPIMFYISAANFKLLITEQQSAEYYEFFEKHILIKDN
ncbi:MAG: tetratricopeptide repeat protein [Bacteroidetes bacterium]|nr:tetratricopeptide repeat protein [Bacteroidota bacterium]